MAGSNGSLTLAGLAQILRDQMDGTAARFVEVANQFAEVRAQFAEERTERKAQDAQLRSRIEELRGEIGNVGVFFRELGQVVLRQVDQHEEHRREIHQIFSRMEQHDARFEAISQEIRDLRLEIRRILDTLQLPGGNGGSGDQQSG